MTTSKAAAEEFRHLTALLAIKTGASVVAVEELTLSMRQEATTLTFDELLSRLLGMAVILGIWQKK